MVTGRRTAMTKRPKEGGQGRGEGGREAEEVVARRREPKKKESNCRKEVEEE